MHVLVLYLAPRFAEVAVERPVHALRRDAQDFPGLLQDLHFRGVLAAVRGHDVEQHRVADGEARLQRLRLGGDRHDRRFGLRFGLSGDGLDEKLLLRSDGTSVYMTQDIGTAILRFRDFPAISGQVYTVGTEQEYHFKVLFLTLAKLGYAWARQCYHLSYGMVDLPTGKMKSREGTVVDADDLMDEMVAEAEKQTRELGKLEDLTPDEEKALLAYLEFIRKQERK